MNGVGFFLQQYLDPEKLIKQYNAVKTARTSWDAKWQLIQDQVFPNYRDYTNAYKTTAPSTEKIGNACAAVAGKINKIVSYLSSQISDPAVEWLHLNFADKSLNEMYPTRAWLYYCSEALYQLFADPESQFYPSTFSFHFDWFTIGSACREIALRKDNGRIKFSTISMQDIFIETSGYNDISTVFRRLQLTAKQAFSVWGEALHQNIVREALQNEAPNDRRKHEFFEVVMPNPMKHQFVPSLDFVSCVIDLQNKQIVDIGVHANNPYVVSRFFISPGETYGRSYVWNAMPVIIALNRLAKRELQLADFATLPITLMKDITSISTRQIVPGAFVQGLDANGRPMIQQMQFGGNVSFAIELFNAKLAELDEALVIKDIIFPLENSNATATEVKVREIQAQNTIRPLLVRLEHEDLNKTVLRTLNLLEQTGRLPQFPYNELGISPEQLPDPIQMLRVSFSGQLAKMQKLQDILNNDLLIEKTLQIGQLYPPVFDRVNLDQLIAQDAMIYGVSPAVINSDEVVQQIREARAQQQQAQQQAEAEAAALDNFVKLKEAGIYAEAAQ